MVTPPLTPAAVHDWVAARSIARDLPPPVADHGGWRVDTASAAEECRYFFAHASSAIATLANRIDRPRVFLKLCDSVEVLAAALPPRWTIIGETWMMEGGPCAMPVIDDRYRLERAGDARRLTVTIRDADGAVAASGHGAASGGFFAYDRIVTAAGHRRRQLGRAVMAALGEEAPVGAAHLLAATAMGRALYESIGWQVRSDYATAVIPG